jgi:hypothetical protein
MRLAASPGEASPLDLPSNRASGGALDELENLLGQLGLGPAADPIYDMILDLEPCCLTPPQLEQAIRSILRLHGFEPCADAVIAALGEVGFAGLARRRTRVPRDGEVKATGDESAGSRMLRAPRISER